MIPRRGPGLTAPSIFLLSNAQSINKRPIPGMINAAEVIQQPTPTPDQLQQSSAGMMILLVSLEMLGQVGNAVGQYRNLNLRRSGIFFMPPMLGDQRCFRFFL
jgi:hypothetical protein